MATAPETAVAIADTRPRTRALLAAAVAWGAILLLYRHTLIDLVTLWSRSSTYAHGWLLVPLVIWLVWRKREELRMLPVEPSTLGVVAFCGTVFLWTVGELTDALVLEQLAFICMFPAVAWAVFGTRCARAIAFPCALALFTVPFADALIEPLMKITAAGCVTLLRLTGIQVYRDGMLFSTSAGDFEVATTCSGIRYLLAFCSIGLLYAYLAIGSWKQRLLVGILLPVIAVLANTVRAYVIVVIAHLSNLRFATGVDHVVIGWLFFALILTGLMFLAERLRTRGILTAPSEGPTASGAGYSLPRNDRVNAALVAAVVCVGGALLGAAAASKGESLLAVPAIGPRGLPTDLAAWQGPLAPHDDWQPEFPGDVTVLRAAYDNATRGGVTVALVFYRRETQGAELAGFGHVLADPRQWHLATSQVIDVDGVGSLNETRFTELSARRSLRVWSAYAVDGRPVTNPAIAKLLGLVWRARQPSEAVSFFAIAHEEDADVAGTDEVLRDFVHTALIPLLHCARHEAREEVCANAHSH